MALRLTEKDSAVPQLVDDVAGLGKNASSIRSLTYFCVSTGHEPAAIRDCRISGSVVPGFTSSGLKPYILPYESLARTNFRSAPNMQIPCGMFSSVAFKSMLVCSRCRFARSLKMWPRTLKPVAARINSVMMLAMKTPDCLCESRRANTSCVARPTVMTSGKPATCL